jgi:hypothetical protein
MTNYNELSDFEINKRVAEYEFGQCSRSGLLGYRDITIDRALNSDCAIVTNKKGSQRIVNYCNSWDDIGPILIREGFDLINKLDGTTCIQDPLFEGDFDLMPSAIDENPLRAIAICYLMKKDLENN